MNTASSTRVFAVGIGDYVAEPLKLRFASANARALIEAFAFEDGCAIRRDHLTLLADREASRDLILANLTRISRACTENDILTVFFSGHGERSADEFFLLPCDADPADLRNACISTAQLELALALNSLEEIIPWILSWGKDCEVVSPAKLRRQITSRSA